MTRGTAFAGRAGSVIDAGLEAMVEAVANAAHTATVQLRSAARASGAINGTTGVPTMTSDLYWSGAARVQAVSVPAQTAETGDEISSRRYLVQLPLAVEVGAGMVVLVVTSTDATLTGRSLIVRSATRGSVRGQRDLICTLQSQEPTPAVIP